MKKIYIKAFAHLNFGDDLFVKILCERYPNTKFYISCSRFTDTPFENVHNLTIMNRRHFKGMIIQNTKRLMNKMKLDINFPFDAQVYIGGSIFIEPDDWDESHKYYLELESEKIGKKIPYYIIGSNFGPYCSKKFVDLHHNYFKYDVQDICFRDIQSYNLFSNLRNVRYAPDVVCSYEIPKEEKKNIVLISCIYNDKREGLGFFSNEQYISKMAEICEQYIKMGKEIVLLSMCNEQKDNITCKEINKRLRKKAKVVEYQGDIEQILHLFAVSEYIIATRFHAMILAWITKTPVFPISYNTKTINVINDYQFIGQYCKIEAFGNSSFSKIDQNRKENYVFSIDQIRKDAERQFEALDKFIRGAS